MGTPQMANGEKIVLLSYWPRQQAGEEHIGFGMPRNYLLYSLFMVPLSLSMEWLIIPRLQPIPILSIINLMTFLLFLLFIPAGRRTGFYSLDEQGKAVTFLQRGVPGQLNGQLGMDRKRFLAQTGVLA
ncbi:hypothetical protein KDA_43790 [Dictyobacter alpinus]|uniref:Uncharacterized protein n=1 Tax=Dictyobacter alpinus TaxID=2014873 RepID=A0A402BC16_9CHLR|nr:hypothetical protein [Dictyobacter alpinus]GCE28895.1 hypothetical protein KDA_43790 [Dictyobacter alpinus]